MGTPFAPECSMAIINAKRILVAHDFSPTSEAARDYAIGLASALHAALDVVHVTDKADSPLPFNAGFEVLPGSPQREIPRYAHDRDIDLIVMGTHGLRSFAQAAVGSVAARVVRNAPCPVLTVRLPRRPFGVSNVLVGLDFEPASVNALAYGRAFCQTFGARLHVLHAMENYFLRPIVPDPKMLEFRVYEQLDEMITQDDRKSLQATTIVTVSDTPADALLEYAPRGNIDLIVLGTHGGRAINRLLLGSVSERVVRLSPSPVLTVHHPERDFLLPQAVLANVAARHL